MILTGYKSSVKMPSYEGDNHIEHPRTKTSDGPESPLGGRAHGGTSCRATYTVRTTGETTTRIVSQSARSYATLSQSPHGNWKNKIKGREEGTLNEQVTDKKDPTKNRRLMDELEID